MGASKAINIVAWACVSSFYYGYHLSELNFPVASLTCSTSKNASKSLLPLCLGMDDQKYSLVTAIFTVGGLAGSLSSSWLVGRQGLKGGLVWVAWMNLLGVGLMALAPSWIVLAIGRLVAGVSSGLAVCLVPPFLSLIARSTPELASKTGFIGTMNQIGIVTGLFGGQVAGLALTGSKGDVPGNWRYIVALPGLISAAQILVAPKISDPTLSDYKADHSIARAQAQGDVESDTRDENGTSLYSSSPDSPLLPESPSSSDSQLPLRELLSNTSLRGPTILCAVIMILQQLSGINAVMFYSTPILKPLLPGSAGLVGIGITLVNAIMTLPAIFLVDRLGRRTLLVASCAGMAIMSALLAVGLNNNYQVVSAVAIISFIASFSIGLGPVPFLLVSEMVPSPAIPALSSLSLSCNWIANFVVAILFLPLRNAFSTPVDPSDPAAGRIGEGRVFYIFTVLGVFTGLLTWRGLARHMQSK